MNPSAISEMPTAPPLNRGVPFDLAPIWAVAGLIVLAALPVGNLSTWLTLTAAGLAMGLIIYIVAAGMTLIFGLMDVMNFGHGAFVGLGAMVGLSIATGAQAWSGASLPLSIILILFAVAAAMLAAAVAGVGFERTIVRPAYGAHLKQILTTLGGMIVVEELLKVFWGPGQHPLPLPEPLKGSIRVGEFSIETYRLIAAAIGLAVFAGLTWVLQSTRLGLLIRASVQNRIMVQAMGYRVERLFVSVFAFGAALAGAGGALWGFYQQSVTPQLGSQMNIVVFVVVIMGGLGSSAGCLVGAILIGLVSNYVGFLLPKGAAFSTFAVMVLVLSWRPQGLYPLTRLELK